MTAIKTIFHYREGTTEPISITLKDGNSAADITGAASVEIFLRSADGAVQTEAALSITTATSGIVSLDPANLSAALLYSKSYYTGYIIVVDGGGDRTSFPSDGEIQIVVLERFSGDA